MNYKDVFIEGGRALIAVPLFALIAGLVLYIPTFILLWIFVAKGFAQSYGAYICLAIGGLLLPATVFASAKTAPSFSGRIQIWMALIAMLMFWGLLVGYKLHVELIQKPLEAQAREEAYAARRPVEESCRDIGVKYGRGAAKALQGKHVPASQDVIIPERCRNDPSTARGQKVGIELQTSGQ